MKELVNTVTSKDSDNGIVQMENKPNIFILVFEKCINVFLNVRFIFLIAVS